MSDFDLFWEVEKVVIKGFWKGLKVKFIIKELIQSSKLIESCCFNIIVSQVHTAFLNFRNTIWISPDQNNIINQGSEFWMPIWILKVHF